MGSRSVKRQHQEIDIWDLETCANTLVNQACTLSSTHISDGTLRLQFNREVSYYAKVILEEVEEGKRSLEEGLDALSREHEHLLTQAKFIAQKGIGFVAGAAQVGIGAGVCDISFGTLCAFTLPLVLHGANNIYENSMHLWEGNSSAEGPVRNVYQGVAKTFGWSEREGNLAYGAVDIGMSAYGAGRLVLREDAWRLFRYIRTDYIRAFRKSSPTALTIDRTADAITVDGMHSEWKKKSE